MANIHMSPQQLPFALSCKHFIYFFTRVPVIIIVIHGHMMSASGKDLALKSVFASYRTSRESLFWGGGGVHVLAPPWDQTSSRQTGWSAAEEAGVTDGLRLPASPLISGEENHRDTQAERLQSRRAGGGGRQIDGLMRR